MFISPTKIGKLFNKTPLAWLQITREKTRLLVALAGIAFADILMFMQLGFKDALYQSAVRPHQMLAGDLFVINKQFETLIAVKSFNRDRLYQLSGIKGVKSLSSMYINMAQWRNPTTKIERTILLIGVDPSKRTFNNLEINQQIDKLKALNAVLYDRDGRPEFGDIKTLLKQSSTVDIQLNQKNVYVIGLFSLGASFAADGNAITSDSTFLRLFPDRPANQIDVGIIKLENRTNLLAIQKELQERLNDPNLLVLTQEEFGNKEKKYWETSTAIGFIFGLGVMMGFIVGVVIVYQILHSDVADHLPEYATLKAMGYTDNYLVSVLLQEALILAVLGFIPGMGLSAILYHFAQTATLLPLYMTVRRASIIFTLTVTMCIISGFIAMRKLRTADPADIF